MYVFIGLENFQEHLCGNYGPRGKISLDFTTQMSGLPPYPFFKVLFCRTVLKVWIFKPRVIGIFMQNVFCSISILWQVLELS